MGFDLKGIKLLIKAKEIGVDFSSVITIGRQGMHLSEDQLRNELIKANLLIDNKTQIKTESSFAEPFLQLLGAKVTDSIDASNYENATHIFDLNQPIPDQYNEKYSLVIDGGSLEHVFNFPVAIKSCMKLIKNNGFYIGLTPTNNLLGHGFYQFSPELYFRIFNETNGFKIIKMYLYTENSDVFEIIDPLIAKERVTMTNAYPTYLCVIAQKIEINNIFEQTPQQSDYELLVWENIDKKTTKNNISLIKIIRNLLPLYIITKIDKLNYLIKIIKPKGTLKRKFFK